MRESESKLSVVTGHVARRNKLTVEFSTFTVTNKTMFPNHPRKFSFASNFPFLCLTRKHISVTEYSIPYTLCRMLKFPVLSLYVLVVTRVGSSYQQVQKIEEKKRQLNV
jgi:hypothetical protein